MKLQDGLHKASTGAGSDDNRACTCAWSSRHHLAFTDVLRRQNLEPANMLGLTLAQVLNQLELMEDPVVPQFDQCGYRWHCQPNYRQMLNYWALKPLREGPGLCLDCVRSLVEGANRDCRIQHTK
jgi:hypothetical protein